MSIAPSAGSSMRPVSQAEKPTPVDVVYPMPNAAQLGELVSSRPGLAMALHADDIVFLVRNRRAERILQLTKGANLVAYYNYRVLLRAGLKSGTKWDANDVLRRPATRDDIRACLEHYRGTPVRPNLIESLDEIPAEVRAELTKELAGDDKEHHYICAPFDVLFGNRYILLNVLGKGSFGTVTRAFDRKANEHVALKISRSGSYFITQAKTEVQCLVAVNAIPKLHNLTVMLRRFALVNGHAILSFSLHSINLYELLKLSKMNGVSLTLTRKLMYQLLSVSHELESASPPIIHCDFKPENVVLNDPTRSGIRVIDFGSACFDDGKSQKHTYIQSRFYRAPEVILKLPYGPAIDRWSIAAMAVEMHTGTPLFPGKSEKEQLARFVGLLGMPSDALIRSSPRANELFENVNGSYKLAKSIVVDPTYLTSLSEVLGQHTGGPRKARLGTPDHSPEDYGVFIDLLKSLLTFDPAKRITSKQAMGHPFFNALAIAPTPAK